MSIYARIETASGAVVDAEWTEGEQVIISQGGHEAGRATLRMHQGDASVSLDDCAARLGAADGSETETAYTALESALAKSLVAAGVLR